MSPRAKLMSLLFFFIKRDPYGNISTKYEEEIADAILDMVMDRVDKKYSYLLGNNNE